MIKFMRLGPLDAAVERLPERYDVGFVGDPLDDRGPRCAAIVGHSCAQVVSVRYAADEPALTIGGASFRPSDVAGIAGSHPARSVLLESTSLDVVEMLLLCRAYLQTPGTRVGFIYAEPERYVPRDQAPGAAQHFEFSARSAGTFAVPGFAHELRDDALGWMVVGVGYESDRLQRILDEDDGTFISHTTLVFGIPPYRTGWELHALLPHLSVLSADPSVEIAFAGANNPRATFLEVKKASEAVAGTAGAQLLVAPLGSKPSSIGILLFACLRNDVRLKYDFPIRNAGATEGIGTIYRYLVERAA